MIYFLLIFGKMYNRMFLAMLGGKKMSEITRVALDAMGGDNAPSEIIKGAIDAVGREKNLKVFLVGQEEAIQKELQNTTYPKDQIEIIHASEVIETAEPPVNAIRRKKDSSIVVSMNMVKKGEADAVVSGRRNSSLVNKRIISSSLCSGKIINFCSSLFHEK